jgi:class 3 adenylate cyclase
VAYKYANFLQHGMAILRAQSLDTEVVPLALWDGKPGDGLWGTASFVAYWRSRGLKPEIIDASTLIGRKAVTRQERSENRSTIKKEGLTLKGTGPKQNIRAMLFADVVAYSQIKDEEIPRFVDHFMGMVAEMVKASRHKPLTWNTWGDALYFVFKSPQDAGRYALQLRDRVRKSNWKKKGLPEGLDLRISLHVGPLYRCRDPVIKKYKYTGSHVSRAARIEPITPPGEVYASEAFAALAAAQKTEGFALDYVGRMPLPKKSGIVPLYLIRRTAV